MNMVNDPAPDHFQDALLSDRLSCHQVQVQLGVLLKDFLVRRQVFRKFVARHAAGLEKGLLTVEMVGDLATQLAQDFRERLCHGM